MKLRGVLYQNKPNLDDYEDIEYDANGCGYPQAMLLYLADTKGLDKH